MLYFIQRSSSTGVSFLLRHCIFAIGPPISLFLAHNQHLEEQLSLSVLSFSQKQMYRAKIVAAAQRHLTQRRFIYGHSIYKWKDFVMRRYVECVSLKTPQKYDAA
jgi:hypothetical protein